MGAWLEPAYRNITWMNARKASQRLQYNKRCQGKVKQGSHPVENLESVDIIWIEQPCTMCILKEGTVLKRAKQCGFWHSMSWAKVRQFWRLPTFHIQPKDWRLSKSMQAHVIHFMNVLSVGASVLCNWNSGM